LKQLHLSLHNLPAAIVVAGILLITVESLSGQTADEAADSVGFSEMIAENSGLQKERLPKSPTLAVSLSAIIPGAGQIYNGSYWKTPVILGIGGYFLYAIVVLDDNYKDYRQRFRDSITSENPLGNNQYRRIRDFYRDQRDRFAWYLGFVYLLNLIDAYVDASLSGFDVSEDLSLRLIPMIDITGAAGLQLRVRF
jgi:TM2 domain-containing membrane protein YozV